MTKSDNTLFVIVGAGASHDASTSWPTVGVVRPPLVKDLFDESHLDILARYPLAQSAAPEIRDALSASTGGEAVSLEAHLRPQYKESSDPYDRRRRYLSIALYLQDLLWQASSTQRVHFDNTDRLTGALVRHFDHVCFLTLNYDLILDQALSRLDPLSSLDHYVAYDRWSLIKLHGSVNWGYEPFGDVSVDQPPADLTEHLGTSIELGSEPRRQRSLAPEPPRYFRLGGSTETKLFPAMTVPVGEEDEVVCPVEHLKFLDRKLANAQELDLLIVGYSAYDRTVIERIGNSKKRIRSLTVVNANYLAAQAVVDRLRALLPQSMTGTDVTIADPSFGDWCRTELAQFVASHSAAVSRSS